MTSKLQKTTERAVECEHCLARAAADESLTVGEMIVWHENDHPHTPTTRLVIEVMIDTSELFMEDQHAVAAALTALAAKISDENVADFAEADSGFAEGTDVTHIDRFAPYGGPPVQCSGIARIIEVEHEDIV